MTHCDQCVYLDKTGTYPVCRRHAPRSAAAATPYAWSWPRIGNPETDGCGEAKSAEQGQPAGGG
jgi:hypothetical protein